MIKWISNVLKNQGDQLSDYSIEYATALLMNLSLRSNGKDKCEDPDIELLKVLNDLVEHDNLQVRTYVNGTLYSIFTRKKLREEAKQLGMPEVLQYLMNQSDDQFKKQIQYILEQLFNSQDDEKEDQADASSINVGDQDLEDDEDDEEDDDDEILEEDDGEFNDIIDEPGVMLGEELLVSDFLLEEDQGGNQQIKTIVDLYQKDRSRKSQNANHSQSNIGRQSPYQGPDGRPPIRPITPIKSSQTTRVQHSQSFVSGGQIDYKNNQRNSQMNTPVQQ